MKDLLLPYRWKFAGYFLTFAGSIMAALYLWFDFRFSAPVFALVSSFLETRMFVSFRTNIADELILVLLISGIGLIAFTEEKTESEIPESVRSGAMAKAIVSNYIFLLFSVLFVYGSGFLAILMLNLISLPVFYLFFFYLLKYRLTRQ